ncbi:MAG TPA: 3-oxoadipate enol-lactonase [Acidimicrobiales bacterium]|jgi:3-oxoadipate enol-lactonase/4-carboxymuconolactone decarboxylase
MPTVDVNGLAMQYRLDGRAHGPLLVLSNSLGLTMDMWEPQLPAFTTHFRVLRHEHRGHGGGHAPAGPYSISDLGSDLLGLLDTLGEPRASVVGLSLGGMVAMWAAAHDPDRIDRLALCCTAPVLPPADAWIERAALVRDQGTSVLLDTLLARWFTQATLPARPEIAATVQAMLAAADPECYASCCEAISVMDQRSHLAAITAPTLVLAGSDDPVVPPASALDTQRAITGSTLVVLPQASHLANVEQPQAFTDAVLSHLLSGPSARAGLTARREVLGDDHVDAAISRTTAFTAPFQDLITRYAWGEIWTRPGLDRATRSCITLSMLVALGRFDELPLHVRGALRNGVSREEIAEVLLQCAIYCGVPAANTAFAVTQRVLDEMDRRPDT